MDAARQLSALLATGLEGTSSLDETRAGAAHLAEVFALGVSSDDLDPDAETAISFFQKRLDATFLRPALVTKSREELFELWADQSGSAMRLMDGIFLALHEVSRMSDSEVLSKRLQHSDRRAIRDVASRFEGEEFGMGLADELRTSLELVELARAVFLRDPNELEDELEFVKLFHRGMLIWSLGVYLSISIADNPSSLLEECEPRPDLAGDALEFVGEGARLAGLGAALATGLEFLDDFFATKDQLAPSQRTAFVAFILKATAEVTRRFGSDVHFGIVEFVYPDEPDSWELHFVIDTSKEATVADAALDRLCEEWWDEAVTTLDVEIYPVIATIARD